MLKAKKYMDSNRKKCSNSLKNTLLTERYSIAFMLSLAFHLLIFFLSYKHIEKNINKTAFLKKPAKIVYIDLSPSKKKKKVYVPESQKKSLKKAIDTNQLSKNDSFVLKEQVKRGENKSSASVKNKSSTGIKNKPSKLKKQVNQNSSNKSSQRIKLGSSDLIFNESLATGKKFQGDELKKRTDKLKSSKPFRRLSSIGSVNAGSNAYLPKIPDGDITLLNSKADQHAVFVSRIALQVFGKLKNLSWSKLTSREINKIRDYVTVKAKMSSSGKFIKASIVESSGFKKFDNALLTSAKEGTWDQNPPSSAKAETEECLDNICFIFKARIWSRKIANNQIEKRWMIMGTGLE